MTISEIAIKFGVPIPETCKQLNWEKQTSFFWVKAKDNNYYFELGFILSLPEAENTKIRIINDNIVFDIDNEMIDFLVPAPQMHEIAPLIPKFIAVNENNSADETNYALWLANDVLRYGIALCTEFNHVLQNYHYAETYAQMYLHLKSKGLL